MKIYIAQNLPDYYFWQFKIKSIMLQVICKHRLTIKCSLPEDKHNTENMLFIKVNQIFSVLEWNFSFFITILYLIVERPSAFACKNICMMQIDVVQVLYISFYRPYSVRLKLYNIFSFNRPYSVRLKLYNIFSFNRPYSVRLKLYNIF